MAKKITPTPAETPPATPAVKRTATVKKAKVEVEIHPYEEITSLIKTTEAPKILFVSQAHADKEMKPMLDQFIDKCEMFQSDLMAMKVTNDEELAAFQAKKKELSVVIKGLNDLRLSIGRPMRDSSEYTSKAFRVVLDILNAMDAHTKNTLLAYNTIVEQRKAAEATRLADEQAKQAAEDRKKEERLKKNSDDLMATIRTITEEIVACQDIPTLNTVYAKYFAKNNRRIWDEDFQATADEAMDKLKTDVGVVRAKELREGILTSSINATDLEEETQAVLQDTIAQTQENSLMNQLSASTQLAQVYSGGGSGGVVRNLKWSPHKGDIENVPREFLSLDDNKIKAYLTPEIREKIRKQLVKLEADPALHGKPVSILIKGIEFYFEKSVR